MRKITVCILLSLTGICFFSLAQAQDETDENGAVYHVVQVGESAWSIADQYGLDLATLLALNNLSEDVILQPGERLLVGLPQTPTSTTAPTRPASTATAVASPDGSQTALTPAPESSRTRPAQEGFWIVPIALLAGWAVVFGVVVALVRTGRLHP